MLSLPRKVFGGVLVAFALIVSMGSIALADSCQCFCRDSQLGAVDGSPQASLNACQTTCGNLGMTVLGCYTDDEQTPENNRLCWRETECTSNIDTVGDKQLRSEWGGQNDVCPQGSGYCYAAQYPVTLNVAVNGITEISNLPRYLNILYAFVLGAASLVAVVMVMIGGLQYATARGDSGKIGKAKERISKAVIGLVLLLSAFVIANLIDPSTTRLNILRLPKVKTVVLLDKASTCETLGSYGFGIDNATGNTTGECGSKGRVTSLPDEVEGESGSVLSSDWKVGDECTYSTCSDLGEVCTADGCLSCRFTSDPSPSTCSGMTPERTADYPRGMVFYCEYSPDYTSAGVEFCGSVSDVASSDLGINCEALRSDHASEGCAAYNDLHVNVFVDDAWFEGDTTLAGYEAAQDTFKKVCADDPCGMHTLAEGYAASNTCFYHASEDGTEGTCSNE